MQSDRNGTDEWQQPTEQPSQAPYVAPPVEEPRPPVVTMSPETLPPEAPQVAQPSEPSPVVVVTEPAVASAPVQEEEPVHWQAHEYIHHEKSPVWFVIFAIVIVVFMAVAIFLMQAVTFAILVPVMAAALIIYSHRPPRLLDYTLSSKGLYINDQLYPFSDFKSFGVIHDGDEYSVMLIPVKRFRLGTSVYFPEEAGESIVDTLGARLPMQELHIDAVDKLIRKLRI
jgi:hypothetical protein